MSARERHAAKKGSAVDDVDAEVVGGGGRSKRWTKGGSNSVIVQRDSMTEDGDGGPVKRRI